MKLVKNGRDQLDRAFQNDVVQKHSFVDRMLIKPKRGALLCRVINCDKDDERMKRFKRALEKSTFNIPVKRESCVDGRKWTTKDLCKLKKTSIDLAAELTRTEVAIALSHRACWKKLVASDSSHMIVFEDDATLTKAFPAFVKRALEEVDFDILYFVNGNWFHTQNYAVPVHEIDGVRCLRETRPYCAGLAAYCVHRRFASMLIDAQFPMRVPVDVFIANMHLSSLRHVVVETDKDDKGCYTTSPVASMYCPWNKGESTQVPKYKGMLTLAQCPDDDADRASSCVLS